IKSMLKKDLHEDNRKSDFINDGNIKPMVANEDVNKFVDNCFEEYYSDNNDFDGYDKQNHSNYNEEHEEVSRQFDNYYPPKVNNSNLKHNTNIPDFSNFPPLRTKETSIYENYNGLDADDKLTVNLENNKNN